MSGDAPLHLFTAHGVEIEYHVVSRETLDVAPICDRLMLDVTGEAVAETEQGELAWSNELALHVVELKTNGPRPSLAHLGAAFQADVARINAALAVHGAQLMPASMHPWMDPLTETRLWPHEHGPVYRAFDRIFGCEGHGWSNIVSTHLNLPFAGDEEMGRLHAAIRVVLPMLPALAASSPVADGRLAGDLDGRLAHYRRNARAVPSVTGDVVPERAWTRESYERDVLGRIYADLAPMDPESILRHEWVNARGAIVRFDRSAIEIRVLDTQECPAADVAILALVTELVRALVEERWCDLETQQAWEAKDLDAILQRTAVSADRTPIDDVRYLDVLGLEGRVRSAGEAWTALAERLLPSGDDRWREHRGLLDVILEHGPLARRLLARLGSDPDRARLRQTWAELCECLAAGRQLMP